MTLERKTPMKRTAMKTTRLPLPRVGKKSRADRAVLSITTREVATRSQGWCEFTIPGICKRRASHMHHRKSRRYGDHSPANLVHICHACHDYAHAHPVRSYTNGWLVHGVDEPMDVGWVRG